MSRWQQAYDDHPFHVTWSDLKKVVESIDLSDKDNVDKNTTLELARLKKVIVFIDSMLESIDAELIQVELFVQINQHATQCRNEVNTFMGNSNAGYLVNANNSINAVMNSVRAMATFPKNTKVAISTASKIYNTEVEKYISRLSKKTTELEGKMRAASEEVTKWHTEQDDHINEVNATLETVKQTIERQTSEFNGQYIESEKSRNVQFEKIVDKLSTKSDSEFTKLAEKLGVMLNIGNKAIDDIKRILNVVVNTAQAGSYSAYANEEKKSANFYRYGTMTLMLLGVSIIIVPEIMHMFKGLDEYVFDWKNAFKRVTVSIVMFVPAFYMASESRKHRANEIKNRQRELVLSTIDPYLELMDDDKKQELKADIAKRIFGDIDTTKIDDGDTANLLAQATNFIKSIKK